MPNVIDRMLKIPDAASFAGMRALSEKLGRRVGGSTGTNFVALCHLASEMKRMGASGSIVSLICDGGDRYLQTYFDDNWLSARGIDLRLFRGPLSEIFV
jgi:cysteine synthase A